MGRKMLGLMLLAVTFVVLLVAGPLPVHAAAGIVQQNNSGCDTCASTTLSIPFLASVASGDVIVAGVMAGAGLSGGTVMSVSDTLGSSFTQAVMALNSFSGAVYIYYAVLSSSGSDTVSVTFTSTTQYQNMYVYEVSGVLATPAGTASGYSLSRAPSATVSTSTSVTFQAGAFLLGVMATDGSSGPASAGPNFQLSSDNSGTTLVQGAEWSTSGVSSPTNFPMSLSAGTDWAEVGIALNPAATTTTTTTTSTIATTQVASATGAGTVAFTMSPSTAGGFTIVTASAVSSVSSPPPVGLTFPYGLFSFTIGGLAPGATVTVTLTLPVPLPAGSFSYWKFQSGVWTQFPSASLDSTRTIIKLTFTADASGTVTDPGGPAITPAIIPEYPLGLPLLAIFMVIGYGLIRRRTRN